MDNDRGVWTIPNLITVVRLALVPVFGWLLWGADEPVAAAVLLAVLGATDWVDGWVARRWDQGSAVGKVLDPVADRVLLVVAAIGMLGADLPASVKALVVVVLVREVLVAGATLVIAAAGAARIDVLWAGKAGTLAVMVALPLFLLAYNVDSGRSALISTAWVFAVPGIALGWYAAYRYLPLARAALRVGRAARNEQTPIQPAGRSQR